MILDAFVLGVLGLLILLVWIFVEMVRVILHNAMMVILWMVMAVLLAVVFNKDFIVRTIKLKHRNVNIIDMTSFLS